MFAIIIILDAIVVGMIGFYLCAAVFGDKPLARLLKLVLGIASGIGYLALAVDIGYGELGYKVSDFIAGLVIFGPIAFFSVLWVLNYMFKDK